MSRVVVLTGFTPGLVYHRRPLLQALLQKGHDVLAVGPSGEEWVEENLREIGVPFRALEVDRNHVRILDDLKYVGRIRALLRSVRPDFLLCTTVKPNVYGGWAAKSEGIPSAAMVTGLGAAFMNAGIRRAMAIRMFRRACRHHQTIFVQNTADRDDLLRWRVVEDRSQFVLTAGSGIDLEAFPPLPLPEEPVFLMLSRLLQAKGVLEYIEASAHVRAAVPQARMILAGGIDDGPGSVPLSVVEAATDRGDLEYLGHVQDVHALLSQASVCVLPSYHEGTPHCLLEGMASGRPVITTHVRGCREVVRHEETGLLVPAGDSSALASAMIRLADNVKMRQEMGASGRQLAESSFGAQEVAKRVMDGLGI